MLSTLSRTGHRLFRLVRPIPAIPVASHTLGFTEFYRVFFRFFCFPFCSVVPGFRCSSIAARVDLFCWLVFFPFCRSAVELKGTDAIERNSRTAADRRRLAHPAAPRRAGVHGAPPIGRDRAELERENNNNNNNTEQKRKRNVSLPINVSSNSIGSYRICLVFFFSGRVCESSLRVDGLWTRCV